MEISSMGLNSDETFCCFKKDLRQIWGAEDDVTAYFGCIIKSRAGYNFFHAKKLKITDTRVLLCSFCTHTKTGNECYNEADATLWVHMIKKKEYSDEWRSKFCAEILPVIKERYNEYFVSDKLPTIYRKRYEMNVYLGKNGFEIVETFS